MSKLKSTTTASKIGNLQKEQSLLMNVRAELTSILNLVNESINALKVEQLQLKAHEISSCTSKPSMKSAPKEEVSLWTSSSALAQYNDTNQIDNKFEINKQEIILDAFPKYKRKRYDEEEYDDDMN